MDGNNRPFEVGDLVVSREFGLLTVYSINPRSKNVECRRNGIGMKVFNSFGQYEYDKPSDIITIRKPRPGNAESRSIVAMILAEYRKEVKDYIFIGCGFERHKDNDAIKAAYNRWKLSSQYFLYQKAKSMLK